MLQRKWFWCESMTQLLLIFVKLKAIRILELGKSTYLRATVYLSIIAIEAIEEGAKYVHSYQICSQLYYFHRWLWKVNVGGCCNIYTQEMFVLIPKFISTLLANEFSLSRYAKCREYATIFQMCRPWVLNGEPSWFLYNCYTS